MVPVSQEQFDDRVLEKEEEEETVKEYFCTACKKKYKTKEMLLQHFQTKKHSKAAGGKRDEELTEVKERKERAEEEIDDEEKLVEKKIEKGRRLGFKECSFCGKSHKDATETAEHMSVEHSFFIPDIEYMKDLEALLSYIGDKVGVGHCCLYCHKPFETMAAARQHMADLGHCKMEYNDENDEFDDFYDFSATFEEKYPEITLSPDGTELIIGDSGKAIGHRDMRVYYEQNVRSRDNDKALMIARKEKTQRLLNKYKQIGYGGAGGGLGLSKEALKTKAERQQRMQKQKMKQGMKNTTLQGKYFIKRDCNFG